MSASPLNDLATLLADVDKSEALPLGLRTSEKLLLVRRLRETGQQMLEYHAGYAEQHQALVSQVYELLGTVTAHSNGHGHWASELPPGTAPAFRRALNALIKFLDK